MCSPSIPPNYNVIRGKLVESLAKPFCMSSSGPGQNHVTHQLLIFIFYFF